MSKLTIQEVNSSIMFGNFTNDQLESIIAAVKFRRSELGKENKRAIRLGDSVKFHSAKRGVTVIGTVEKIAIKYITVRESNNNRLTSGLWRVPANMLETV